MESQCLDNSTIPASLEKYMWPKTGNMMFYQDSVRLFGKLEEDGDIKSVPFKITTDYGKQPKTSILISVTETASHIHVLKTYLNFI